MAPIILYCLLLASGESEPIVIEHNEALFGLREISPPPTQEVIEELGHLGIEYTFEISLRPSEKEITPDSF